MRLKELALSLNLVIVEGMENVLMVLRHITVPAIQDGQEKPAKLILMSANQCLARMEAHASKRWMLTFDVYARLDLLERIVRPVSF